MAINQTLEKIGLNEKEIRVYLALLKHGKTKPSVLATLTKLNRATIYNIAKNLLSMGIITEDISDKKLHFAPLPPKNLSGILEQKKREIQEKEELIKKAVNELSLITADKIYPVPKIRFVEENDLEKFLFDNTIKWQKEVIATDGIWWGFQDHSFVEHYEKWIDSTWKTAESKHENYRGQLFSNVSEIENKMKTKHFKLKRNIRFLEGMNFTATVWVCGDYLVLISTHKRPFYLFEIHDKVLAHNMREMFKKLWATSNG